MFKVTGFVTLDQLLASLRCYTDPWIKLEQTVLCLKSVYEWSEEYDGLNIDVIKVIKNIWLHLT